MSKKKKPLIVFTVRNPEGDSTTSPDLDSAFAILETCLDDEENEGREYVLVCERMTKRQFDALDDEFTFR